MKLLRELLIILLIYFIGEILSKIIPLSIPGNILGLILLLILLCTNIIKLQSIETVSNFFLDHLAFFFIPASVGLITSFDILKGSALKLILICIISTILVMLSTGYIVQFIMRKKLNKSLKEDIQNG